LNLGGVLTGEAPVPADDRDLCGLPDLDSLSGGAAGSDDEGACRPGDLCVGQEKRPRLLRDGQNMSRPPSRFPPAGACGIRLRTRWA